MARRRTNLNAWAFVAFPLTIVFLFVALPTVVGVGLSFFEWSGGGWPRYVGLQNYRDLFGDPATAYAVRNTLIFAFTSVPITTLAAFLFAAALNANWFVGTTVMRTVFFLPTVVSIVAIGFLWRWVLEPTSAGLLNGTLDGIAQSGPVTAVADAFGYSIPRRIRWPDWLGNTPWALTAIILVSIWRMLGYCIVLYLAALGGVPRSYYEAAAVDGATPWKSLWHITWPSVRPVTFFLLVTGMIGALQVFDVVLVMIGRIEQRWTDVLNLFLYREFLENRLGYAATIGVIVLALTIAVTALQFVWMRRTQESMA